MGFPLNTLIDLYIKKLSGAAFSRKYKKLTPIWIVYQDVMSMLNKDDERAVKAKEEIIGKTALETAPEEYWTIGIIHELGITYPDWKEYELTDKAILIARHYLSNMIQIIDGYYKYIDDAMKRLGKNND